MTQRTEACGTVTPHEGHEHGHISRISPVWCEGIPEGVERESLLATVADSSVADWAIVRASAKVQVLQEVLTEVNARLVRAPRYADTTALKDLVILLGDKIREQQQ
jgi:hypothetical protein